MFNDFFLKKIIFFSRSPNYKENKIALFMENKRYLEIHFAMFILQYKLHAESDLKLDFSN